VPKGEIVAIVGANGAGKTSLIRAIAGIQPSRSGKIVFNEKQILGLESHRICNLGIGQVAEGRQVFPTLSILENLEVGAMLPRARRDAKRTLDEVFAMFPRLAERSAQLAGTLSGGEQQMLATARALMFEARLLAIDEPSLGLAPKIREELFGAIRKIHDEGVPVLLVEQEVAQVFRMADRNYVLSQGRIIAQGAAKSLMADETLRAGYLGL
jgi:branched-chain amino acid transport system ATP-binding protein